MTRDKEHAASAESWTVPDRRSPPVPAASAPLFSPGDVLAERYELRRILGRGGMGVVFEAHDRMLDQAIALKIVRAEYAGDRAWAERLAREVKLARQINHPNVCRVFDLGVAERHPFLTMELASRGTLREEMASGELAARPLEDRLSDVRAIASGLAAIHAAKIIHRDVAPQNVLRMHDGSLVLSDFGLATDRFDGTSSIQGGTLTYMAPEVVRGARASMASDIWSLGILTHELIFRIRPRWSPGGALLEPRPGQLLSGAESAAFVACRACTRSVPARRPTSAVAVQELLRRRGRIQSGRRTGIYLGAALLASGAIVSLGIAARKSGHLIRSAAEPRGIAPEGSPRDWSDRARILASVPEKIQCLVPLPDGKTVRFVWGVPRRAEDVDTQTGTHRPSPLVPAAYAEGCPGLSRDNKLLFAGHDTNDRAAVFLSSHPDGRDAAPVVAAGEPSLGTDPAWLPDGNSFLYTVDISHSAIYSLSSHSSVSVPADTRDALSTWYAVLGHSILVTSFPPSEFTDIRRFRFPGLSQDLHLRVSGSLLDAATSDGRRFFVTFLGPAFEGQVTVLDSAQPRLLRAGIIPRRYLRYPVMTDGGLALVATSLVGVLTVTDGTEGLRQITVPPEIVCASACGDSIIAQVTVLGTSVIGRLDRSGNLIERMNLGRAPVKPICSADGRTLYYYEWSALALMRCDSGQCREIYRGRLQGFQLSPDDRKIVALMISDSGLTVGWLAASGEGPMHELAKTQVACVPGWSPSGNSIWFSTRRGARLAWVEVSADSGEPTGHTSPGGWDCMDDAADPASPVKAKVRIDWNRRSEVRFVPSADLQIE